MIPLLLITIACAPAPDHPWSSGLGAQADTSGDTGDAPAEDPVDWLTPHWAETVEICDPPDPFVANAVSLGTDLLTDACMAKFAEDLGFDQSVYDDLTVRLLLGESAYHLMGRDLGTVDKLLARQDDEGNYWLRQPFRDAVQEIADLLGDEEVSAVLYDMVTSVILTTSVKEMEYWAVYHFDTRHMDFSTDFRDSGLVGAGVLVHEAAHGWTNINHVECPEETAYDNVDYSGMTVCDEEWNAAHAFGAATYRLLRESIPPEEDPCAADWFDDEARYCGEQSAALILAEQARAPHRCP